MSNRRGTGSDPWMARDAPHGLRFDLSDFVGRSREVTEVGSLLEVARVVTLTGPSGIGKTRLALEVAHRRYGDYSGGVWFVDLAPINDPELVPQAAASTLGLEPEPGRDPLEALCARLRPRTALLVLDNCEHLVDACATLAERVADDCAGISILATSQQALGITAERTVGVSPMSLPEPGSALSIASARESEAINLFCSRATASHRGFRLTDEILPLVAQICRGLDGIPLAIELAAARVAVLGPGQIAERIGERFRLLTQGATGAQARHQTLRAALDWSHDLLSDREAMLFRRLSVFGGGAGLPAVEEVCSGEGVPADHMVDLLTSLVAKSLVVADTSQPLARYHMLETIRAYGRERVDEAGEWHEVSRRHATWCAELAEASWHHIVGGHQPGPLEELEAEHDNLRAALTWAVGAEPGVALRLVTALIAFWETRGYLQEGRQWLERTLDALASAGQGPTAVPVPAALHAKALWGLGLLATLGGDVASARPAVQESLRVAREGGSDQAYLQALNLLGLISVLSQDPLTAKPFLEESVTMGRAAGDRPPTVAALIGLGRAHLFLGEISQARALFEECLALAGEKQSGALIGLARAALAAGEEESARELFEELFPLVSEAGDRFETSLVLSFLGELAWARGDLATARSRLEDGLELALAMGAPFPRVRCLYGLAKVAHTDGDPDAAASWANQACQVATSVGLPYALVRSLHVRAGLMLASGDTAGAAKDYDDAVVLARANSDRAGVAQSWYRLAALARVRGADDEAMELLYDALALQAEIGNAGIPSTLEAMAGMDADQGRPARAARLFGAAETLRQTCGQPRHPDEVAAYDADVALLRTVLGEAELTEAWAAGAGLPRDEAVALALRARRSGDPYRRTRDPDRAATGWASLTSRERLVVDLVADGMTNPEIAARLGISDRTVQSHLTRVFRKLAVASRRELREAVRHLRS